jgi:uncharacterized membrane protein YkvA (DUF1232 family)
MPEIAQYVQKNGEAVTPAVLAKIMKNLPLWKAEYAQISAPKQPHLVRQLLFLADAVEDFADGETKELPYVALAEAVFALLYAHKHIDIIPDSMPAMGRVDDSSIVRAVLIRHQKALGLYAASHGKSWSQITSMA